jgi:putative transposase
MLKSFKFRIYPSQQQKSELAQAFGCSRFVYNNSLAFKIDQYQNHNKNVSCYDLINRIKNLKEEFDWLKSPPSQALQQSLKHLDSAYNLFFKRGNKGFPKFKNKYAKQSISLPQNVKVNWKGNIITLPKIGRVVSVLHRKFEGKIKTCTISKTVTDKYYCSILVETNENVPPKAEKGKIIGIDLGIKDFVTTSNGDKIKSPKFYNKCLNLLRILQQKLSNKIKGSNNYRKMKLRIAKLHEYISNCREDFLHKLSKKLIDENQAIFIEDLNVKNLQKISHKVMNRHISDVSWSMFSNMLQYKAEWYVWESNIGCRAE